MRRFRDIKIRTKLITIMVLTGTLVLLPAMVAMVVMQNVQTRRTLNDELQTLSAIVSWNSGAAMAFRDQEAAEQTLAALDAKRGIVAAYLYDNEGELFGFYVSAQARADSRELMPGKLPPTEAKAGSGAEDVREWTSGGHLNVVRSVMLAGESVGTLQIIDDLSELDQLIQGAYLITALIILAALALIVLLSARLQRIFSEPVRQLIAAMNHVTGKRSYDTRVSKTSNDEFGELADVFNEMLAEVESRDQQLASHRRDLERQVADRTSELSTAVASLEATTREAEAARDAAEAASRAKSEFLATMSHEIRTPMNGVLGMAELLATSDLSPRQARFAATIQSSGNALLEVINDILDFSKIESGMLQIDEHEFHLGELMENITDLMFEQARRKSLDITLDMPSETRAQVLGDSHRIHQVLINLLGNAIKFTSAGRILLSVLPQPSRTGHLAIRCEVTDSGIGISPAMQDKIFESFTQADNSTSRKFGGTGLGLSISRQLVELMGGRMGVISEVGQGATFWFELEFALGSVAAADCCALDEGLSGLNLLVVDDSSLNREILAEFGASWGMGVATVPSAEAAERALADRGANDRPWDAILLDLHMPEKNGVELAMTIRRTPGYAETPLLMLSSTPSDAVSAEALAAGVDRYLQKPVRKAALRQALGDLLQGGAPVTRPGAGGEPTAIQGRFHGRVLLAEDNEVNQEVGRGMLLHLGLEVVMASDGLEAVSKATSESVDLVLMDCHMPGQDGFAAARAIRAEEDGASRLPIVAVTANVQREVQAQCLAAGMDGYLSKPFTWEQLIGVLEEYLPAGQEATATGGGGTPAVGDIAAGAEVTPDVDTSVLSALRVLQRPGQPDVIASTVQKYGAGYTAKRETILRAMAAGDLVELAEAAHFLKSSSASLGAMAFSDSCRCLEGMAKEGDCAAMGTVVDELVTLGDAALVALENFVGEEGYVEV